MHPQRTEVVIKAGLSSLILFESFSPSTSEQGFTLSSLISSMVIAFSL
jgi:hypothetical protein